MISFDDNSGSSNVNLNPIYMSLNILSDQQQTFESDLNDMMIDIQLISNSLSTLTGGGGNEYYITNSATNTDKLSFCYNLKDNITGFNFTDKFNNINMNGGSFSSNTISDASKMFNLNGASAVLRNVFSSNIEGVNITCSDFHINSISDISNYSINALSASVNYFASVEEIYGHIGTLYMNSFKSFSGLDLSGYLFTENVFSKFSKINLNCKNISGIECNSGVSVDFKCDNLIYATFIDNYNVNIKCTNISRILFSNVNTLSFNGIYFKSNRYSSTMGMMYGNFLNMNANKISDVSKISLNGNTISDNIFNNCTICDINALTFKSNTFSGNNTIKLLNMTCDLINSNSFGFPKIANIMVSSFNNNTIDVAYYLDLKADTIISNAIFGGKLNGMFDGQGNTIFANYATLCGTLISNDLKLINGRIHGGLAANTIHGSSYSYNDISSTIGRLTINNYTSFGLNTNVISCFDVVHVDGERGPMLYKDIRKLYLDSLNSDDSFSNVKSIYYSDSFALGSNHYTNIGTLYYWQNKTQPSWSP